MITGNMVDAASALQYGLVNYVVPQEELLSKARSILELANSKAPLAVARCIQLANAVFDHTKNGFKEEVKLFGECFVTEDMKEGTSAFLEKRKPNFRGN
jgi:enoyl-CoA hydratase